MKIKRWPLIIQRGFTLIELIVFSAIASLTLIAFVSILLIILRIQVRQQAVSEVTTQSQFLIQTIQRYVQTSSLVDGFSTSTPNTSSSKLDLRMSTSSTDYVRIYQNASSAVICVGGSGYCDVGSNTKALTTSKVNVSNLTFTYRVNSPAHELIGISFTMSYNTSNPKQLYTEYLQTSATRASEAIVYSDATGTAGASLGISGQAWSNINQVIYFNGSNVGINARTPTSRLMVGSGDVYIDTAGKGLVIKDTPGTCWIWTPASSTGVVTATTTPC